MAEDRNLVPEDDQLLNWLREQLATKVLPGTAAQATMAPSVRGEYAGPPATARRASVLALLYPSAKGRLTLLYIQRTSPKSDRHAGQISFPGGSVDEGDRNAAHTALRELEEEVGISQSDVGIIGALSQLYVPVSNFLVDPFVGWMPRRPAFLLQESEVARVLELPFAEFFSPEARRSGPRKLVNGMTLSDTPYWAIDGEEIWGATAMMTAELIAIATV